MRSINAVSKIHGLSTYHKNCGEVHYGNVHYGNVHYGNVH